MNNKNDGLYVRINTQEKESIIKAAKARNVRPAVFIRDTLLKAANKTLKAIEVVHD